jgi:hypothetical protein
MFYYKVESSHWPMTLEFKSAIKMEVGQCFRIKEHDGLKSYPTRFKVVAVSDVPEYKGTVVEIISADFAVEAF